MAAEFTTSAGVKITIRPVSQFRLEALSASDKEVEPPTYDVVGVTGVVQKIALDEESATNKGRLDEWHAYQADVKKAKVEHGNKFMSAIVWFGVDVEVPGPESEWQQVHDMLGIELPDHPAKRKYRYLKDEMLATADDLADLVAEIMRISQMSEEVVAKLRNSFRRGIRGAANKPMSPVREQMESPREDLDSIGDSSLLEIEALGDGDLRAE